MATWIKIKNTPGILFDFCTLKIIKQILKMTRTMRAARISLNPEHTRTKF